MPVTPARQSQKVCFARSLAGSVVKNGFDDVAIITGETEAVGHGLFVDEKSVEQCMALLMGKSLPAYVTHEGAIFSDRLGEEIGYFSGFYRDGLKLKAKQFRFFDSALKHELDDCEHLMELAAKMPDQFGISIVFGGSAVWVTPDGMELSANLPMPKDALRSIPSVRMSYVESADFVKAPAANPDGLFAAKVDAAPVGQMDPAPAPVAAAPVEPAAVAAPAPVTETLSAAPAAVTFSYSTDKDAELKALAETHTAEVAKIANLHREQLAKVDTDHAAALAKAKADADATIADLKAKLAEAESFDIRKSGAPALSARLGEMSTALDVAPKPGAKDHEKWAQYEALRTASPERAAEYFRRYLRPTRK